MTYIILRDTFGGDSLKTIPGIGLDVIDDDQIDEWIISAAEVIAEEDGYEDPKSYNDDHPDFPIEETLVICKLITNDIGSDYIRDVIKNHMDKQTKEQYALYLKLKEKFEKDTP